MSSEAWQSLWQQRKADQFLGHLHDSSSGVLCQFSDASVPLHLQLKKLQGLSARQVWPVVAASEGRGGSTSSTSRAAKLHDKQIRASVSTYCAAQGCFIGSTWSGSGAQWQDQTIKLQQSVVFHAKSTDQSLYIVIELVLFNSEKDICLGWSMLSLAEMLALAVDNSNDTAASKLYRLKVYHGSPRCLFFMKEPYDVDSRLMSRVSTELHCNLSVHSPLVKALPLMAEYRLYSLNDVLPGIKQPTTNAVVSLLRPKLLRLHPASLRKAQLRPTTGHLDECERLINDHFVAMARAKNDVDSVELPSVTITERRLLVGVHNGHTFTKPPRIILLDIGNDPASSLSSSSAAAASAKTGTGFGDRSPSAGMRRASSRGSSRRLPRQSTVNQASCLQFVGEVALPDIPQSESFAVVCLLEYVAKVQEKAATTAGFDPNASTRSRKSSLLRQGSLADNQVVTAPVAVGFLSPFPHGSSQPAMSSASEDSPATVADIAMSVTLPMTSGHWDDVTSQLLMKTQSPELAHMDADEHAWTLDFQLIVQLPVGNAASQTDAIAKDGTLKASDSMFVDNTYDPSVADAEDIPFEDAASTLPSDIVALGDSLNLGRSSLFSDDRGHSGLVPLDVSILQPATKPTLARTPTEGEHSGGSGSCDQLNESLEPVTMVQTYATSTIAMTTATSTRLNTGIGKAGTASGGYHGYGDLATGKQSDFPGGKSAPPAASGSHVVTGFPSSSSIPRAMMSLLSSNVFPGIDAAGVGAENVVEVSPYAPNAGNLLAEESDSLQCNDITLQFLAVSRLSSSSRNVFLRFQFYDFPAIQTERLELLSADSSGGVFLFRAEAQNNDANLYGSEAHFPVDWTSTGSADEYVQTLSTALLQIQIIDSQSLLVLGTANMSLKHLLRQGRPAIQCSHALDLVVMETADDLPYLLGDWTRQGTSHPDKRRVEITGTLYVRTACVGSPADPGNRGRTSNRVVTTNMSSELLTSLQTPHSANSRPSLVKCQAKKMADLHPDLRDMLGLGVKKHQPQELDKKSQLELKRKLDRMQCVREALSGSDSANAQTTVGSAPISFQLQDRQLKQVNEFGDRIRRDVIDNHHLATITSHHSVHAQLGVSHLIEYKLHNPFTLSTTFKIDFEDAELSVVTDSREWRMLKERYQLNTAVEEEMFVSGEQFSKLSTVSRKTSAQAEHGSRANRERVLLRAGETLHIPLKYHWMDTAITTNAGEGGSHGEPTPVPPPTKKIKVLFIAESTNSPAAILFLNIERQRYSVHHTVQLAHSEHSVMKRRIRTPVPQEDGGKVQVYCKYPGVVCEVISQGISVVQDIYLKVPCDSAPGTKAFIVLLYRDEFLISPVERWLCTVQSVQRVDLSGQMFQSSSTSIVLRGSNVSRNVKCFVSNPKLLKIWPANSFVLSAHAVHDVQLTLQPTSVCQTTAMLNLVDIDQCEIINTWQVHCNCLPPTISKVTNIKIPSAGGKGINKRIQFKNTYATRKRFCMATSHSDLLQFKETMFEAEGSATQSLSLCFTPQVRGSKAELLVFINLEEGVNEECMLIKITYT